MSATTADAPFVGGAESRTTRFRRRMKIRSYQARRKAAAAIKASGSALVRAAKATARGIKRTVVGTAVTVRRLVGYIGLAASWIIRAALTLVSVVLTFVVVLAVAIVGTIVLTVLVILGKAQSVWVDYVHGTFAFWAHRPKMKYRDYLRLRREMGEKLVGSFFEDMREYAIGQFLDRFELKEEPETVVVTDDEEVVVTDSVTPPEDLVEKAEQNNGDEPEAESPLWTYLHKQAPGFNDKFAEFVELPEFFDFLSIKKDGAQTPQERAYWTGRWQTMEMFPRWGDRTWMESNATVAFVHQKYKSQQKDYPSQYLRTGVLDMVEDLRSHYYQGDPPKAAKKAAKKTTGAHRGTTTGS